MFFLLTTATAGLLSADLLVAKSNLLRKIVVQIGAVLTFALKRVACDGLERLFDVYRFFSRNFEIWNIVFRLTPRLRSFRAYLNMQQRRA